MTRQVRIAKAHIGAGGPLMVIAGPCVIESREVVMETAAGMKEICERLGLPFVFKSSFDKANRTSISSFRGPGLKEGLGTLADVKMEIGVPVISDVHEPMQIKAAAGVLDAIQIPAFMSRQTDLILAAARSGKPVNIKKGQFLSPWDAKNIVEKFESAGGKDLIITERGTSFGYNNLVVDFRSFPVMRGFGAPVVYDLTHSLQLPGGQGTASGGQREFAPAMLRAAAAVGIDGVFLEVHPDPENALCDGPNMVKLSEVENMLRTAKEIDGLLKGAC
jgi:2-dehydro-3-deoxyphosphooctonate aldolase (KDO 8-P synthase)